MPISLRRAQKHISSWSPKLPYRSWWPRYLFFAAHVTAVADIVRDGRLKCRRDLQGAIAHDIANKEALGANPHAQDFVRLYYRPKTPFHLRTEGVKLLNSQHRLDAHMSVPVMLVFDLVQVVTRANVHFCDRKMAHIGITPGNDESYFDNIDFSKVYHDSPITDPDTRREIHDRRMAEVLIPGELPLDGTLSAIVCRTQFDALTLGHILGEQNSPWRSFLRVSTSPAEMFFCWETFLTELQFEDNTLFLKIKTSKDYMPGQAIKFSILQNMIGLNSYTWRQDYVPSNNTLQISGWYADNTSNWSIEIEDALAFLGQIPAKQTTVVGS